MTQTHNSGRPQQLGHPSVGELTALLAPCHARNQSVNDTAAAVYKLFSRNGTLPAPLQRLLTGAVTMALHHCFNMWQSVDATVGEVFELFAAADTLQSHPVADCKSKTGNQVTMTGHQLQQALALTWPEGQSDPEQGFTVVTIGSMPAGRASNEDGVSMYRPAGLYISFDDMPDQGMQQLLEVPDPRAPSASS